MKIKEAGMACPYRDCSEYPCLGYLHWKYDHERVPINDHIRDFLKYDTWTVDEAMWLLTGLSPLMAKKNNEDYLNGYGEVVTGLVRIDLARPLHEKDYLNSANVLLDLPPLDFPLVCGYVEIDKRVLAQRTLLLKVNATHNFALQSYNRTLNHHMKLWRSGAHSEDRYPIEYYLKWADAKGLFVPWADWAKEKGLIPGGDDDHCIDHGPWMNPGHEYYPHELSMAVNLWRAAFESYPPESTKSCQEHIKKQLDELYPGKRGGEDRTERKNNRGDRLVALLNPNKKGELKNWGNLWKKKAERLKNKGNLTEFEIRLLESREFFSPELSFALHVWREAYGNHPEKTVVRHHEYIKGVISERSPSCGDGSKGMIDRVLKCVTPKND